MITSLVFNFKMTRGKFRSSKRIITFSKRGLILCEGETEENYFRGLVSQEQYRRKFSTISVEILKPKNHSPLGLVNEAKERVKQAKSNKNPYDFVWIIFDRDGHAKLGDAFEIAREFSPEINIAFTIPCFEFFVLLHFEKTAKPFTKCDDVISHLKKQNYISNYEKSGNLFQLLSEKMDIGIANCEWLVNNCDKEEKVYNLSAYTNIHDLVKFLYDLISND